MMAIFTKNMGSGNLRLKPSKILADIWLVMRSNWRTSIPTRQGVTF
jgi:hypothetical protein